MIDGNNIIDVYNVISKVSKSIRKNPKPVLLEFKTFRMKGHEEASGQDYIESSLIEEWAKKDPIKNYERFLLKEKILSKDSICLLYTSPSPRDLSTSRMPSSA